MARRSYEIWYECPIKIAVRVQKKTGKTTLAMMTQEAEKRAAEIFKNMAANVKRSQYGPLKHTDTILFTQIARYDELVATRKAGRISSGRGGIRCTQK